MKNFICDGERIQIVAPSGGLVSGDLYLMGSKVVAMVTGGLEGDTVVGATEGVFEVPKATGAVTLGQSLFFDNTAKNVTTTAAGNSFAGYAYKAQLSADATVQLLLVDNPGDATSSVAVAAKVAACATADATDLASAEALANALKVKVNAIISSLTAAGLMSAT